eukprot:TRINITY_DN41594_c0_g1_i2.p3 TRINITY_DN41594_c0_g1~~TRINITY_DN41594_c0_g1_i2.p3  ORF type:complete len:106 (-),score=19.97 TRINITY_DN41594_c0_g1_i2:80-397(-)
MQLENYVLYQDAFKLVDYYKFISFQEFRNGRQNFELCSLNFGAIKFNYQIQKNQLSFPCELSYWYISDENIILLLEIEAEQLLYQFFNKLEKKINVYMDFKGKAF